MALVAATLAVVSLIVLIGTIGEAIDPDVKAADPSKDRRVVLRFGLSAFALLAAGAWLAWKLGK